MSCMLYVIESSESQYSKLFEDDPVRPYISKGFRCHMPDNISFVLVESEKPAAVICCSFKSYVPSTTEELLKFEYRPHCNAIFYTVWSYSRGGGRRIIPLVRSWISEHYSHISGFYTYSPLGDNVRDFHYSLGAQLYRENSDSINYVYS